MKKSIKLKAYKNKKNGQIKFELKKSKLPKKFKEKLPKLKGIKIKFDDFEFLEE